MLKYGNRDFRNLQEQVYANMKNIQDIIDGSNIIADLKTANIVGEVSLASSLPDPETYTGDYGDAYLVGQPDNYDLYVFTKAYEEENAPQWFKIGEFPQPGPQGPQGPAGPGLESPDELLNYMEGSSAVDVELNQSETKVKIDLSAAEKAIIDNKLALPANAPAETKVVAVNTSKEQIALGIGDGLQIVDGVVKAKVGVGVEIDDNGALSADIPNALVLPETAPEAEEIVTVNTSGQQASLGVGSGLDISSGDLVIEAAEKAKIDNSLQLPAAAPATEQLVTINTSKAQSALGIGAGLDIDDGKLVLNTVTIDFNGGTTAVDVSETIATNIAAYKYDFVKVINYGGSTANGWNSIVFVKMTRGIFTTSVSAGYYSVSDFPKVQAIGTQFLTTKLYYQKLAKTSAGNKVEITSTNCLIGQDSQLRIDFYGTSGTAATFTQALLNNKQPFTSRFYPDYPSDSSSWCNILWSSGPGASESYGYAFRYINNKMLTYILKITHSTGVWSLIKTIGGDDSIVTTATVYAESNKTTNLGSLNIYADSNGKEYIKIQVADLALNVYDTASNILTVANKTIKDFKTGEDLVLKLAVKASGNDYYLSGGLVESVKGTLGFTKPSSAVGAIELTAKITNSVDYFLAPDVLFSGSAIMNSIPTQYTGINRNTITTIDCGSGSFIKLSGSEITFGADSSVSLDFCIDQNITKGITVTL